MAVIPDLIRQILTVGSGTGFSVALVTKHELPTNRAPYIISTLQTILRCTKSFMYSITVFSIMLGISDQIFLLRILCNHLQKLHTNNEPVLFFFTLAVGMMVIISFSKVELQV